MTGTCAPCADAHPNQGCADVGCSHNCQQWIDRERPADHPDNGHTFRFIFDIRGSSKVVGDPEFTDAQDFAGLPYGFTVRGWSLVEALTRAAGLPFATLMGAEVPPDDAIREHLRAALRLSREHGYVAKDHAGGPFHYSDERLVDMLHEIIRG